MTKHLDNAKATLIIVENQRWESLSHDQRLWLNLAASHLHVMVEVAEQLTRIADSLEGRENEAGVKGYGAG